MHSETRIPKTIHFCWYGNGEYNDTIKKCIKSWEEKLPDYTIKKWDESNTPFKQFPFLKLILKQKKWSFITDFIRLYAIYTEGGIYLDTDIEIVKDFGPLLNEECFLGFEAEIEKQKYPINSAVIGSEKGAPFILDCLKKTEYYQRLRQNAIGGPKIVSKMLMEYGVQSYGDQTIKNVRLLPKEYFYPFGWNESFSPDCVKKETVCIHWWEHSWGDKKKDFNFKVRKLKFKLIKLPSILIGMITYKLFKNRFYLTEKHL